MKLSVIIPTYNEEENITHLLTRLFQSTQKEKLEIIIVDGCSTDKTKELVKQFKVEFFCANVQSRAAQMNFGAKKATGDVLYFVHADTLPPISFYEDIQKAIKNGNKAGCYRFKFNSPNILLRLNAFMTRFPFLICRGGDQSLFVTKELFFSLGMYDEYYSIMEEYDLIQKIKSKEQFKVIQKDIIVSARKYRNNSYLRVQKANYTAFKMFKSGVHPDKIKAKYYNLLN
jgi:rSAM/selenodomain-associated transferase 2